MSNIHKQDLVFHHKALTQCIQSKEHLWSHLKVDSNPSTGKIYN